MSNTTLLEVMVKETMRRASKRLTMIYNIHIREIKIKPGTETIGDSKGVRNLPIGRISDGDGIEI